MGIKPAELGLDAVNLADERELDALTAELLAEGNGRIQAEISECVRLGILDVKGNLLRHDIPEDMREGAETDFGG
ncbi:MAG TPA: hypothetical protein VL099_16685 [Candidatus Binatia bacterium]|nr:hypothetical protein [Candidatus Binatia bacterium]